MSSLHKLKSIMKKQSNVTTRRIAVFHDRFRTIGGSEKLALILANSIGCDVIAAEVDQKVLKKLGFGNVKVIPLGEKVLFPFMLSVMWKKRFLECDLSSQYDFFIFSGNFSIYAAKKHTPNIWYCHTPPKWQRIPSFYQKTIYNLVLTAKNKLTKKRLLPPFISKKIDYIFDFLPRFIAARYREMKVGLRGNIWQMFSTYTTYKKYSPSKKSDFAATRAIDSIVVNSHNIQKKVQKHYGRESLVIYPPVDCDYFAHRKNGNFWLSVNRMIPAKRVEMQIEAFRRLPNETLVIVGECEEHHKKYSEKILKKLPRNVIYKGVVSEEKLRVLYANCAGFITTAEDEDFGMTPVEAMASGKPVIAPNEGGYKETVINGNTGILIDNISPKKIIEAVKKLGKNPLKYKDACIKQARKFDTKVFVKKIKEKIRL